MKDRDVRSFVASERQRFINYVRSLVRETAEMDAEDIVHDVLVNVLERADLPASDYLTAYVFRSLKNRVIDHVRTRKPTVSIEAESDGRREKLIDLLQDLKPDVLTVLQTQEGKEELFRALEELSDMERDVIIAHELEGVPFKELARIRNVPLNTLLSHKSRAMKKLKKHFSKSPGDKS
ncbi:MAG: RNA polymerase sigma factor [Gammaproteobacteria bacterium]|nr:RNA polymerase sigma factor [Gammaproteobacteria bacterium]